MIPIRDDMKSREWPLVTYTLIVLNSVIFLWDRLGGLNGSGILFSDLALRPAEIIAVLQGRGDSMNLVSLFASLFLHVNLMHLMGNLLFLLAFGGTVEHVLGPVRYALYYFFWGLVASAAHIYVLPSSMVPTLGASGAIGGVLGAYFLLFPGNRVQFMVFPLVFWTFPVIAWQALGFWFLLQVLIPQEGVANWAHAGGFAAGMATVLILGGRDKLLKTVSLERVIDEDFE